MNGKEALKMILGESESKSKVNPYTKPIIDAKRICAAAHIRGMEALEKCKPTPMIVSQHNNPLDDNSPVKKAWYVPQGVCGFAWVNVKFKNKESRLFINQLKRAHDRRFKKDDYYGGFTYWCHEGGQSYELKMAFASAYAATLRKFNILANASGRLD